MTPPAPSLLPVVVVLRDPHLLTVHPLLDAIPALAADAPEMLALLASVELHGLDRQPLVINERDEILDGRARQHAARKAGLTAVPCIVRPEEEAAAVVVESLCARRHLSKSALAYLVHPLLEETREAREKARVRGLLAGKISRKPPLAAYGKSVDETVRGLGYSPDLAQRAGQVHAIFEKHPKYRALMEPKLLGGGEDAVSLRGIVVGLESWLQNGAPVSYLSKRTEYGRLVAEHLTKATDHFRRWADLDDIQREIALQAVSASAGDWPEAVLAAIAQASREAKRKEAA